MNESVSIKLYKYMRSDHALVTLATGLVKVATFDSLNDPFEFLPGLTLPDAASDELIRTASTGWFKTMTEKYGMICMSESVTDPVLWSHYADQHTGMALEFDHLLNDSLVKVTYSPDRVMIDVVEFSGNLGKHLDLFKKLMRQKYQSWQYERERRVFVQLSDCTQSDGLYFMKIPDNFLTCVVLGARCTTNPQVIREVLDRSGFTNTKIAKANCHLSKFEMEVQQLS